MVIHPPSWLAPPHLPMLATSAALGLVLALEAIWPRRAALRRGRWPANLGLIVIAGLALSALPVAAVGTAAWARQQGIGLFAALPLPPALEVLLAVVALDGAMYWQHRSMHGPDWLWRLHRVHHSDLHVDATTALRFHPVEMLVTLAWKLGAVLLLGASPLAVLVFEALTGVYALFIHSNLRLPAALDARWRRLFVTPDLHRVHHSVRFDESNRNFGTILSLWDRGFGSHAAAPRDGHAGMQIGLPEFRDGRSQSLAGLLLQPWRRGLTPAAARGADAGAAPGVRAE